MSDLIYRISEQLGLGLFPDLTGRTGPFFIDGVNITFENGGVYGGLGHYTLFIPPVFKPIVGIHATEVEGNKIIFFGTASELFKWDEVNGITVSTRSTGPYTDDGSEELWSFINWGNWVACTKSSDVQQLWQGGDRFRDMTGLGAIVGTKIFTEFNPFAILLNQIGNDKSIDWSSDDAIEEWIPAATNLARGLQARGFSSEIKAAKPLGDVIAVYSTTEMRALEFVGAPFVFGLKPRLADVGAVGKQSVCAVGAMHYGLGPRGFWRADLSQHQYLSHGRVHDFIFNNINKAMWYKTIVFHDQSRTMVCCFYPSKNSLFNDRGVGYNYINNSWTIFDYGRSAAQDSGVFDFAITGTHDGAIIAQSASNSPIGLRGDKIIPVPAAAKLISGFGELGFGESGFGGEYDSVG